VPVTPTAYPMLELRKTSDPKVLPFVAKASGMPNLVLVSDIVKTIDFIDDWLEPFKLTIELT
jgi:hypothetical protein